MKNQNQCLNGLRTRRGRALSIWMTAGIVVLMGAGAGDLDDGGDIGGGIVDASAKKLFFS